MPIATRVRSGSTRSSKPIVALSAAVSPLLLSLVRTLYLAAGGTPRLGLVGGTAGRLVLSALVLAVPTIAMGGTLPAAARAVTRQSDVGRRDVAMLYGLNTLGAVVGCLVATFFLLEHARHPRHAVDRRGDQSAGGDRGRVGSIARCPAVAGCEGPASLLSPRRPRQSDPPARESFLLIASAIVGFAFFLMELVWYRMLGPLLGGSVFTFGLILAVALAGIGIGGLLYALTSDDRPASLSRFAASCLLEAAALAGVFALGDRLAVLTLALRPLASLGFGTAVVCWTLVTMVVVLPAAIVAGYQFPLLIALFGRGRDRLGRQVGLAYAANTLGAIGGSLAGGFGLLPWLSAPGAWRLAAMLLVALGACATALSWRQSAAAPGHHVSRCSAGGRRVRDCRPGRGRSNRRLASQRHRRGARDGDPRVPEPVPRLGARAAARDRLGRGRHRKQRGAGGRAQRLRLHRQRQVRRQRARRRRHAGDARAARRHPASGGAPLAGHRARHRQHRRLAGRGSRHGSGRRRRARAADHRCRARVRRGQPRRAAKPQGPPDDWRRARNAADRARALRPHRVGAVESVPRRRREPLHA